MAITPQDLESLRLQLETAVQLAKRVRRDATLAVQSAAKAEAMAAQIADLMEDSEDASSGPSSTVEEAPGNRR